MDMLELIFTGIVALVVYACFYRWVLHRNRRGPKIWPILGCSLEIDANRDNLHDWLLTYFEQFTTISVPTFNLDYIMTTDPANVEHVLKTRFENYPKGRSQYIICEELLGDGIFNSDGDLWKRQRKTASYAFASKVLRDFSTNVFRDGALQLSSILARAVQNNQPVDMQDLFMRMTLDTICKVGFGTEIRTLHHSLPKNQFAESFDAASEIVLGRFVVPLWKLRRLLRVGTEGDFIKHKKVLDEFSYTVIEGRIVELERAPMANKEARSDLLSRFILQDKDISLGSTKTLRDAMLNFTIAGRDTSAISLSWLLYLVSSHPEVEDKILAELLAFESELPGDAASVSDDGARIQIFADAATYESLSKLEYLHAAITETLRLYPPVPLDNKICESDDTLPDGTRVKKGQMVTYAPYCMGHLERLWGSDASQFRPERWLKDGVFQPESPFKFISFNAGPRTCLGKDFAYLQMKMTAAVLLRIFKFQLVPGHNVHYRTTLVLPMKDGLRMTVRKRNM